MLRLCGDAPEPIMPRSSTAIATVEYAFAATEPTQEVDPTNGKQTTKARIAKRVSSERVSAE